MIGLGVGRLVQCHGEGACDRRQLIGEERQHLARVRVRVRVRARVRVKVKMKVSVRVRVWVRVRVRVRVLTVPHPKPSPIQVHRAAEAREVPRYKKGDPSQVAP